MSITNPDLSLELFPDQQDTFPTFLDITPSDGPIVRSYFNAIQAGNQALATQIFNTIPSASQKILTAQGLNKFSQCLVALERFYGDQIEPYIATKQTEWTDTINQFSWQGVYDPATQYYLNNYVTYTQAGVTNLYIATAQPQIGTLPTNPSYWRVLTIRGQAGVSGTGVSFTGTWVNTQAYVANDCVTYSGALWNCVVNNTAQVPYQGSNYWQLVYQSGLTVYPVSAAPPATPEDGTLWFQILS